MATISKELKTQYTWDNASFNWNSLKAEKSWFEAGILAYVLDTEETVEIDDQLKKDIGKNCLEKLAVYEYFLKQLIVNYGEIIHCFETYWDNTLYHLHVSEMIGIADDARFFYLLNKREFIGIFELVFKSIKIGKSEFVNIKEQFLRSILFLRRFEEVFLASDNEYNGVTLKKYELFDINDFIEKQILAYKKEKITFDEDFERRLNFVRNVMENVSVDELCNKEYGLNKQEAVCVFDALIRACESVLSNISLNDGELTLAEFLASTKTPPGYDEFAEYKVGDYEYQQALVRLILQACSAQSEPLLSGVNVHVDIDDVDDRGVVVVEDTSAAVKVYYNKHYYTAPEVNITVKGGNTSTGVVMPTILATDGIDGTGRFFIAELRDISGNRCVGTFAWVSKGY